MRFIQKILLSSFLGFFTQCALAMEQNSLAVEDFPNEMIVCIFLHLDLNEKELANLSLVSKSWHEAAENNSIWARLFEIELGKMDKPLLSGDTWKTTFKSFYLAPLDIINMRWWSNEKKLLFMSRKSYYREIQASYIKHLERAILSQSKKLNIDNSTKLTGFYLANFLVNFKMVLGHPSLHPKNLSFPAVYPIEQAYFSLSQNAGLDKDIHKDWYTGIKSLEDLLLRRADGVLKKVYQDMYDMHPNLNELYGWNWRKHLISGNELKHIFVLVNIAQPEFQDEHLKNFYDSVLYTLKEKNFNLSGDEVMGIIASCLWNDKPCIWRSEKLDKDDPFIISLWHILEAIRPKE